MKPIALVAVTLLSFEAASLTLPTRPQKSTVTNGYNLPSRDQLTSVDLIEFASSEIYIDKRNWQDWVPSAECITCLLACMKANGSSLKEFVYRQTRLTATDMSRLSMCGLSCILVENKCFDKDRFNEDPFLTQSEVGRINTQYKDNDMIEGAGSGSPIHNETKK